MTKLEQIEKSILELSPDELKVFTDWFEAMVDKNFDDAVERDARSGKLDEFASQAILEHRSGRSRPL